MEKYTNIFLLLLLLTLLCTTITASYSTGPLLSTTVPASYSTTLAASYSTTPLLTSLGFHSLYVAALSKATFSASPWRKILDLTDSSLSPNRWYLTITTSSRPYKATSKCAHVYIAGAGLTYKMGAKWEMRDESSEWLKRGTVFRPEHTDKPYDESDEGSEGSDEGSEGSGEGSEGSDNEESGGSNEPYDESNGTEEENEGNEEEPDDENNEEEEQNNGNEDEEEEPNNKYVIFLNLVEHGPVPNCNFLTNIGELSVENCETYEDFGRELHHAWSEYVEREEYLINPQPHDAWPGFSLRFLAADPEDDSNFDLDVHELDWEIFREQVFQVHIEPIGGGSGTTTNQETEEGGTEGGKEAGDKGSEDEGSEGTEGGKEGDKGSDDEGSDGTEGDKGSDDEGSEGTEDENEGSEEEPNVGNDQEEHPWD